MVRKKASTFFKKYYVSLPRKMPEISDIFRNDIRFHFCRPADRQAASPLLPMCKEAYLLRPEMTG